MMKSTAIYIITQYPEPLTLNGVQLKIKTNLKQPLKQLYININKTAGKWIKILQICSLYGGMV